VPTALRLRAQFASFGPGDGSAPPVPVGRRRPHRTV